MIRAATHSSYPRVGESPLDQQVRSVLRAHARGRASQAEVARVQDEVASIVVAEQSRAFIDIVTDGLVRWEGPLSHVAAHLDGIELGGLARWFDTNFYDRTPVITGPVVRRRPFLVHEYEVAHAVGADRVKMVLPGPVTFARMARDRHYGTLEAVARAVADALAQEVSDLAGAGARIFQLDEPLLCRHPEDAELVTETAGAIFAEAGPEATTVLSTYFGELWALADDLGRLPGTHLGVDLVRDRRATGILDRLPDGKGVALGVFDARTTRQEDAADVAAVLGPHREVLVARDVHVGPQAGLELLPRDAAFDKLLHARYLAEKLSREWAWRC